MPAPSISACRARLVWLLVGEMRAIACSTSIEEIALRTLIVSAVFSILGTVAASQAQDLGDAQQGRQLALNVCASCHAVRAGETQSPLAKAPSFEEIAHKPGMTAAALAFWFTARSHPTMPNFIFSPQQVRNASAYILSLRD